MSGITSDALRGKKAISTDAIAKLCISGGHTRITESIQSGVDFRGDVLSAAVAIHVTPDARCGQAELVTMGGPLNGSIKASKI